MWSYASHCATLIQVVNHVEDKGVVGCFLRCEPSGLAETVVIVELVGGTPFCGERGICHYRIELCIAKGIPFQRIAVLYLEVAELDAVQQHIHPGKVVSGRVLLLPVNIHRMTDLCRTEKQRSTTASRVIHIAKPCATDKYNLGQYLTDLLRSIELSGFFSGSSVKLANHILIGIAKNVNLIRGFHTKLYVVQCQQYVADEGILVICRLAQFR